LRNILKKWRIFVGNLPKYLIIRHKVSTLTTGYGSLGIPNSIGTPSEHGEERTSIRVICIVNFKNVLQC
jgi:hypothetical protein